MNKKLLTFSLTLALLSSPTLTSPLWADSAPAPGSTPASDPAAKLTDEEVAVLKEVAKAKLTPESLELLKMIANFHTSDDKPLVIGKGATSYTGPNAKNAEESPNVIIGKNATVRGQHAVVLGSDTKSLTGNRGSVVIGFEAKDRGVQPATAIGWKAVVSGTASVAIGGGAPQFKGARALYDKAVAIGSDSLVTGDHSSAIGPASEAHGNYSGAAFGGVVGQTKDLIGASYAIGMQANVADYVQHAVAIGLASSVTSENSVALGAQSAATREMGARAYMPFKNEVLEGAALAPLVGADMTKVQALEAAKADYDTKAQAYHEKEKAWKAYVQSKEYETDHVANNANFEKHRSGELVAIHPFGALYKEMNKARIAYGAAKKAFNYEFGPFASVGTVAVGAPNFYRQITGVAAGSADTDAVNVAQLKQMVDIHNMLVKATGLTNDEVIAIGTDAPNAPKTLKAQIEELRDAAANAGPAVHFLSINSGESDATEEAKLNNYKNDGAKMKDGIAIGVASSADGEGSIAIGKNSYVQKAYTAQGNIDKGGKHHGAIAIGEKAQSFGHDSVVVGRDSQGVYDSTVIGAQARAFAQGSVAVGSHSVGGGQFNDYLQTYENAYNTAVGTQAVTRKFHSSAYGYQSKAEGRASTALGAVAKADGLYSVALGTASQTSDLGTGVGYIPGVEKLNNDDLARVAGVTAADVAKLSADVIAALKDYNEAKAAYDDQWAAYYNRYNDTDGAAPKTEEAKQKLDYWNKLQPAIDNRLAKESALTKALFTRNEKMGAWAASYGKVSIGNAENKVLRQLGGLAAGYLDTDAVNVAQLKQAVLLTKNLQKATGLTDEDVAAITGGGANAPKTLVDRIVEAAGTGAADPTKYVGAKGSGLTASKTGDTVTYNLDLSKNDQFKDLKNLVNTANANATAGWNVRVGGESATVNAKQGMIFGNSDDNIELLLKAGAQGKAHQLDMKLADDLKIKNSVNVGGKDGATLTQDGMTLGTNGPSLTKDGLDMKGSPITNVGTSNDPNSLATVGQVKELVNAMPGGGLSAQQLAEMKGQLSGADAANAALGALQPLDYDELRPTTFSFGMGFSGGSSAVALGLTHYFNADKAFNVGASLSGDAVNWRLGASWRLGQADERAVQTGDSLKTMQNKLNSALSELADTKSQLAETRSELEELKQIVNELRK